MGGIHELDRPGRWLEFLGTSAGVSQKTVELSRSCINAVRDVWTKVDEVVSLNQLKVISAFRQCGVTEADFSGTTGYGYGDTGRDRLEELFARVLGARASYVRPQLICGTSALYGALHGTLEPGETLVCITGRPYDTLAPAIRKLVAWGVAYKEVDPWNHLPPGAGGKEAASAWRRVPGFDEKVSRASVVLIQRSRGYGERPSLLVDDIAGAVKAVREVNPEAAVIVDNCYGEFVEEREPSEVGADLVVGSLMKNPGGGLAPTGGYVAGNERLVESVAEAMVAPGLGKAVGPSLGLNRYMFQGLFLAPKVVGEALKSAIYISKFFEEMGYAVSPRYDEPRGDIVQRIKLGTPEQVKAACRAVQMASPVDSAACPVPWKMPGYEHRVIMAAGTFVQGSSIELSADAPMRPPYAVYVQGGLVREQAILACALAAESLFDLAK